jgi:IS30 family transposase
VLVKLPGDHSAQSVGDALIELFAGMPGRLRRTLTWGQGNEMPHHQRIEGYRLRIYFADPHAPRQRSSNEDNGLLRHYLPKGTDLSQWTDDQLHQIATEPNDRPRLCPCG